MNTLAFKPTDVNHEGLTALIQNLGRDCPPSQYLREFLKNAIEACQRTSEKNYQIILDFNEDIYKETGYYKMSFIDNGDGMSDEQMLEQIYAGVDKRLWPFALKNILKHLEQL